jgi:hypothetical protein
MWQIDKLFFHKGYKCVVILADMGHRCGYVGVGPANPLYNIDLSKDIKSPELLQEIKSSKIGKRGIIDVFCWDGEKTRLSLLFDVHGGLTYSGSSNRYPTNQIDPLWWFGFDCAHAGDAKDWDALHRFIPKEKYQATKEVYDMFPRSSDMARSTNYVIDECKSLAEQIDCVSNILQQTRIQIEA